MTKQRLRNEFSIAALGRKKKKEKGSIQGVWFVNAEEKETIKLKRTSWV